MAIEMNNRPADLPQPRILIPCDPIPGNPYLFQLIRALDASDGVGTVQHGIDWLRSDQSHFDVVHLQWPEALSSWHEPAPSQLDTLERVFRTWRSRGTLLACTVHNEFPHGRDTPRFRQLYALVYRHVDLFFHFGATSITSLTERFPEEAAKASHTIVPHGNYDCMPTASSGPSLIPARFQLLCVGRLRSRAEIRLVEAAADYLRPLNGRVTVVGRLPSPKTTKLFHYVNRLGLWSRRNAHLIEAFAPDDEVSAMLAQADALLIPRIGNLNSGNVALAFTFGRVAIGPNSGVIGEELSKLGNPTFDPSNPRSLKTAIERAVELAQQGHGELNRKYAQTELDWRSIAQRHLNAYKRSLEGMSQAPSSRDRDSPA